MISSLNARDAEANPQEQILSAATRVFAEQGYRGTSMRDIAAVAGFSHSLLFYHFNSKDNLYLAVVQLEAERLRKGLADALAGRATALEKLQTYVDVSWTYFTEYEPELAVILRELNGLPKPLAREVVARNEWALRVLHEIVEEGIAEGTFRAVDDVSSCVHAISAILYAFIRSHAAAPGRFPPQAAKDQILNFYLVGLLA